jgi:hypothetical protein
MRDLKSRLRAYVKSFGCRGATPKEFEEIWFKPDCWYWSYDDIHNGIVDKFYLPLSFVAKLLAEEMEREHLGKLETNIIVMPAVADTTYAMVVGNGLFLEEYKDVDLWWASEEDFEEWVEERLKIWREKLQVQLVPKKARDELKTAYRQYAQAEGSPEKAFEEFTRVCEAYLKV